MIRKRSFGWLAILALVLGGCGDDNSDGVPESETCGLYGEIDRGAGPETIGGKDQAACVWGPSSDSGLFIGFILIEGSVAAIRMDIAEVTIGEVGSFPVALELDIDEVTFEAECTAEITEHSEEGPGELGTDYQLRGEVACSSALASMNGETLSVTSMSFATTVSWVE